MKGLILDSLNERELITNVEYVFKPIAVRNLFLFSKYRKVTRSNTFRLEAHAGFFRLLMKGIFDLYVSTVTF